MLASSFRGMPPDDYVFANLLDKRIVFVLEAIDNILANRVISQLMYLEGVDAAQDIKIYINNSVSALYASLSIYDAMQQLPPAIQIVCMGVALGGGAIILSGGTKGKRFAFPSARILLELPTLEFKGKAANIEIQARELRRARELVSRILARNTGQPLEEVEWNLRRPHWMAAQEAKEDGLIDVVLDPSAPPDRESG